MDGVGGVGSGRSDGDLRAGRRHSCVPLKERGLRELVDHREDRQQWE